MKNYLFIAVVTILTILIICASVWLGMSIVKYSEIVGEKNEPSSITTESPKSVTEKPQTYTNTPVPTKTPAPTNANNSAYILPSDSREISKSEIMNFDYDTLNRAYNEIFARHGHDFKNKELKVYFEKQSWYKPVSGKTVGISDLSELEIKNMNTIKARIDEVK